MDLTFAVMESVREMLTIIGAFIPRFIGLMIILLLGWGVAKLAEAILVRALKLVRLDTLADKGRINNFLAKGGIKYTLCEVIGVLAYWVVMLIVIATALNAMQWAVAAELVNKIVLYVPNIIVAIVICVFGMFAATVLSTIIRTAAGNAGIGQGRLLGEIAQTVVIIFAAVMALQQLKIEIEVLVNVINIVIAALGLAFGLAFGLGCKDIAGKYVEDLVKRLKK